MQVQIIGSGLIAATLFAAAATNAANAGAGPPGHSHATFAAGQPADPKKPFRTIEVSIQDENGNMKYVPGEIQVTVTLSGVPLASIATADSCMLWLTARLPDGRTTVTAATFGGEVASFWHAEPANCATNGRRLLQAAVNTRNPGGNIGTSLD